MSTRLYGISRRGSRFALSVVWAYSYWNVTLEINCNNFNNAIVMVCNCFHTCAALWTHKRKTISIHWLNATFNLWMTYNFFHRNIYVTKNYVLKRLPNVVHSVQRTRTEFPTFTLSFSFLFFSSPLRWIINCEKNVSLFISRFEQLPITWKSFSLLFIINISIAAWYSHKRTIESILSLPKVSWFDYEWVVHEIITHYESYLLMYYSSKWRSLCVTIHNCYYYRDRAIIWLMMIRTHISTSLQRDR